MFEVIQNIMKQTRIYVYQIKKKKKKLSEEFDVNPQETFCSRQVHGFFSKRHINQKQTT